MSFLNYLNDKLNLLLINVSGVFLMSLYLLAIDVSISQMVIILLGWLIVLVLYLLIDYKLIMKRYHKWLKAFNGLDKKYLIAELIKPDQYIEHLYYHFLKKANKSMIEEINYYKTKEKEYEEYIEQWVHEMKTPISAISLLCASSKTESSNKIDCELKKINNLVTQTLFFAKSEFLHKDLFIKKVDLNELIHHVILDNKFLLQEKKFQLIISDHLPQVLSDQKWLTYIINQMILNSIKYSNKEIPVLKISSMSDSNSVVLVIEDNGIGINPSDLPRVFDKGFTGINRSNQHSTGLGLYLCKKLCDKMNIELSMESEVNQYTRVLLIFRLTNL